MTNSKALITILLLASIISALSTLPVLAAQYDPGVTVGQYVKYGNFVGIGPGLENFNNYDWLKLQVTNVSSKSVTLLSTSQFKNGTAILGNGSSVVWNVETGTADGVPRTQGPIIAGNLNQGDAIPPPNTFSINATTSRSYGSITRTVNQLNVAISTPDYNTTLTYVYDRASGMLLEASAQTTTQTQPEPVTSTYSYSVIETNIFGFPSPSPTIPEFPSQIFFAGLIAVLTIGAVILLKRNREQKSYTKTEQSWT